MMIFRMWSKDLVGRLLWQESHMKVLILGRVGSFQIPFPFVVRSFGSETTSKVVRRFSAKLTIR